MNLSAADALPTDRLKEQARLVRERMPAGGLFKDQEWRTAPAPFELGPQLAGEIEALGRVFVQFYKALNQLYRRSVNGKMPAWIAAWMDQGKPERVIALQRSNAFKNDLPRVIRPDLLLTEQGLAMTELDSVPGGIGLTAWLNQTYADLVGPAQVIGGRDGMIRGFEGIFGDAPRVSIVVSEEAGAYRPEMEWLCRQIAGERFAVRDGAFTDFGEGEAVYRFFELFDLANVASSEEILRRAVEGRLTLTPPPKPVFEEKLALALLWNGHLGSFWRQEMGEGFFKRLQAIVPRTWVVDPAPLPPHGAIPDLNITDWRDLKLFSQRERELILKISGYSEKAWGARGVHLGSDLSHAEWGVAVDEALAAFSRTPYILQRYRKPRVVPSSWFDFNRGELVSMPGRARLCPYYFLHGEGDTARPVLGGVLATICPEDKKIIHGMSEAVLAPCSA